MLGAEMIFNGAGNRLCAFTTRQGVFFGGSFMTVWYTIHAYPPPRVSQGIRHTQGGAIEEGGVVRLPPLCLSVGISWL